MTLIASVIAFVLGALLAFFWRGARIAALSTLLSSERATREKMQNEFRLAASEVLEGATRQVVADALKDFRQVRGESDMGLEHKKDLITSAVMDMKIRLDEYQKNVQKFEDERNVLYGRLEKTLVEVLGAGQSIRMEAASIKRALTSSVGVQGNFGQILFEQILEQNGLIRGIGYETQVVLPDDAGGTLRPDFIVNLPGNKKLIVDSKAPIGEYLQAEETQDTEAQREHHRRLACNMRDNVNRLSRKEYQALTDSNIRFVVMFIPVEGAIRAAFSVDPTLFQEAQEKGVLLASPMTVVPLIQLIAHSWQQYQLASNAKDLGLEVEKLGQRLYTFVEHLQDIRQGLKKANEGWNNAVASWQSRVSPQLEKARSLGGKLKDLPEPEALAQEFSESPLQKNLNLLQ
jgi:DNA recombination protein RmuC